MIQHLAIILFISFIACQEQTSPQQVVEKKVDPLSFDSAYKWVKVLDSADWKKSYNFQMLTIRDTLWVFHPDGNWFSVNGTRWKKSSLSNAINNLAFLDYVLFKNAVFGLGHFEGNIEKHSFTPAIYQTTDLKQWTILSNNSNLPARFFYHPFVFDHKLWIIAGEDEKQSYADAWHSTDAVHWEKVKDDLAFGKQSGSQVVHFKNKLFLLNNDVWSSTDALTWKKETDEILKGEQLFGYAAVVFDQKIWLIGCNRNGKFSSQVLVSSDGRNWATQDAPWTPRGGVAATVFKGKVYITGGKYGGTPGAPDFRYSNDIWSLEKTQ